MALPEDPRYNPTMSPRRQRLFAWISLAAILVVHLRLDALASRLSAAATADEPRPCCCCSDESSGQPTSRTNGDVERGDGPLHPHGCPCCPDKDCCQCCVFCVYAKAPCGPTATAFCALPVDDIVSFVTDLSTLVPPPPVEEFFQPPRA